MNFLSIFNTVAWLEMRRNIGFIVAIAVCFGLMVLASIRFPTNTGGVDWQDALFLVSWNILNTLALGSVAIMVGGGKISPKENVLMYTSEIKSLPFHVARTTFYAAVSTVFLSISLWFLMVQFNRWQDSSAISVSENININALNAIPFVASILIMCIALLNLARTLTHYYYIHQKTALVIVTLFFTGIGTELWYVVSTYIADLELGNMVLFSINNNPISATLGQLVFNLLLAVGLTLLAGKIGEEVEL